MGDDAKMRCKYCTDETSDVDEDLANRCNEAMSPIEEVTTDTENPPPSTSKVRIEVH